jgi:catechol 2,3-dioxygenase-like lactoylglutathione lyase family enzyme
VDSFERFTVRKMKIERLDHLVLTVRDIETACVFYSRVLGMEVVRFGSGRVALKFGEQKINLHPAKAPIAPHAERPTPGSADLCFISTTPIAQVIAELKRLDIPIVEGPVRRTGARGPLTSVYLRDPDGNLIEVSNEEHED